MRSNVFGSYGGGGGSVDGSPAAGAGRSGSGETLSGGDTVGSARCSGFGSSPSTVDCSIERDSAVRTCCDSSDGPFLAGTGILLPSCMLEDASALSMALGGSVPLLASGLRAGEPIGDDADRPSPPILDIASANLSSIGLEPRLELGLGRGRELVISTDSRRGVIVPPRPWLGGTPTSFVGTALGFVRSSASTTASTSSMHMSTFSGFRSVWMIPHERCM